MPDTDMPNTDTPDTHAPAPLDSSSAKSGPIDTSTALGPKLRLGWEEWVSLPGLNLPAIRAKVDTGARTSALHAVAVEPFGTERNPQVRFIMHPDPDDPTLEVMCSGKVIDKRTVVSSNGEAELRYVIRSDMRVGERTWPIELTLTNRETMSSRMLLGREALADNISVNPSERFLQPELSFKAYKRRKKTDAAKRPLRIALLTQSPGNWSNRAMIAAAEARGHVIECVQTSSCYMAINKSTPAVHYRGEPLERFDAVIPRIGASITFYGLAVVRQFEAMGVYCLNSANAIGNSRDKLLAHQVLASHRLGMPATAFASTTRDTKELIDLVGGAPVVLKLLESTQGKGVVLADTKKVASAMIDAFSNLEANFLVQEFVKEAAGEDIRAFVVQGKVVGAMKRTAASGDFRSNLHQGGTAAATKLSREERQTAIRAARALNLTVAGVDILRSDTGPKILEVNSSPGLQGISKATGKDVAGTIIECIESNVSAVVRARR